MSSAVWLGACVTQVDVVLVEHTAAPAQRKMCLFVSRPRDGEWPGRITMGEARDVTAARHGVRAEDSAARVFPVGVGFGEGAA